MSLRGTPPSLLRRRAPALAVLAPVVVVGVVAGALLQPVHYGAGGYTVSVVPLVVALVAAPVVVHRAASGRGALALALAALAAQVVWLLLAPVEPRPDQLWMIP